VDVQPEMIRTLTGLARRPGLQTIKPVLGAVDNVKPPPASVVHKMTEAQVHKEAAQHVLPWERTSRVLPCQHIVVFRNP
jgi:hypothetical protein